MDIVLLWRSPILNARGPRSASDSLTAALGDVAIVDGEALLLTSDLEASRLPCADS